MLKIALDVHLARYIIPAQEDSSSPQTPQRFKPADFLKWVRQRVALGSWLATCYETNALGHGLHQQLTALGLTNNVIRPSNWDDQHIRVRTDRTDALSILNVLDRFVAGARKALASLQESPPGFQRSGIASWRKSFGSATSTQHPRQVRQFPVKMGIDRTGLALARFQPQYRLTKKWKLRLLDAHATSRR